MALLSKGQASIELISILAVALLVLGMLVAASRTTFEDMQAALDSQLTERSLRELSLLAKQAYESGPGAIQKTVLHVPTTVVSEESYIADNIVNIRIEQKYGVKDIPQLFDVPIKGSLSFTPGDYEVYVISHSGYVFITESPSLLVSRTLVYTPRGVETSITVKNPGHQQAVIRASSEPGIVLSWYSQSVAPGGEVELKISASSAGKIKLESLSGEYELIFVEVS